MSIKSCGTDMVTKDPYTPLTEDFQSLLDIFEKSDCLFLGASDGLFVEGMGDGSVPARLVSF